jgi:hypothetical protein
MVSALFTTAPEVIIASRGYFRAVGLVRGFMAASIILFSAYQGWGKATPLLLVGLLRVGQLPLRGLVPVSAGESRADRRFDRLGCSGTGMGLRVQASDPDRQTGLRLKM